MRTSNRFVCFRFFSSLSDNFIVSIRVVFEQTEQWTDSIFLRPALLSIIVFLPLELINISTLLSSPSHYAIQPILDARSPSVSYSTASWSNGKVRVDVGELWETSWRKQLRIWEMNRGVAGRERVSATATCIGLQRGYEKRDNIERLRGCLHE